MKTMKSLIVPFGTKAVSIVSLALLLGGVGLSHAGGRQGQGWNVTYVTGTHSIIASGGARSYLKKVTLSSANTETVGDAVVCYSSNPTSVGGAGRVLLSTAVPWITTYQITPAIVYSATMSYVNNNFSVVNNEWKVGDSEYDYIEIGSEGALVCRQTTQGSGQANTFTVHWSR